MCLRDAMSRQQKVTAGSCGPAALRISAKQRLRTPFGAIPGVRNRARRSARWYLDPVARKLRIFPAARSYQRRYAPATLWLPSSASVLG